MARSRVPKGFNKDNYCTPMAELALVYAMIGVPDLDPCSGKRSLVASVNAIMPPVNSLLVTWLARTIYMNPPYSNTMAWVLKFLEWFDTGNDGYGEKEGVMLLSAEFGLIWWQEILVKRIARMILLPRVAFLANGNPIKGNRCNSMMIYMGHRARVARHVWPAPVFRPCAVAA